LGIKHLSQERAVSIPTPSRRIIPTMVAFAFDRGPAPAPVEVKLNEAIVTA
jgi:hypothetical protein